MNNICTTIEQSKKLLELGLDPSTADMGWNIFVDGTIRLLPIDDWDLNKDGSGNVKLCYAWSLTALLELMPYFIIIKEEGEPDEHYHFQLNRNGSVFRSKRQASYKGWVACYYGEGWWRESIPHSNPIDSCVSLIETLYKQHLL